MSGATSRAVLVAARWRTALCCVAALAGLSGCERASFESLGTLVSRLPNPPLAGALADTAGDAAEPPDVPSEPALSAGSEAAGAPAAGGGGNVAAGAGPPAGAGAAGSGPAGQGGSVAPSGPLTGSFPPLSFASVQSAWVIGRSDEYGATTVYMIDAALSCDEVSSFAWLTSLPDEVQVIELMFASSASTGVRSSDIVVSYAHGGMYSFMKTPASMRTLTLSQNSSAGAVAGRLDAAFPSGSVSGDFRAEYCATGTSF
jgi:hypothetical protein